MSDPTSAPSTSTIKPLQTLVGVSVTAGISVGLGFLAASIAQKLGTTPLPQGNATAANVASAVRTFLLGFCIMGSVIFGVVALGVLAWTIQQLLLPKTNS
ncbi:DUF3082 domain-containing protein [Leptolyngbya sp. FACHB-261]|uniref:DUF3082 domain-containing protein n=1 Tax=Leptolyngbya sp. FACHB-261 TaxID=2692806 RepID=UPI001688E85B|nr:DUF3082 domain-containing protein [Leptolyngbya sp. FACHB-261]MBD2102614.1 DUF3082 domain-containing protein [Leptolyngbya sp. FACHB-261]